MFCSTYNNFDLSSLSMVSLDIMIWGICIGVLLAILISLIDKSITSSFIQKLLREEAKDETSAKSLKDLKPNGIWYLKIALNAEHKPLRRYLGVVKTDSAENDSKKKSMDRLSFYLPEENRIKAEMRFSAAKRPVFTFVIAAVLVIAAGFFIQFSAPELMTMLDNFLSSVKG